MVRILVAEDEKDIRELIKVTLEYSGFEVTCVRDGREAVELALSQPFDLIIMDVRMPRMTGYAACRALRRLEATRSLPIVFLSAKGQASEVQAGLDAGANAYIIKPFAPQDLINQVREVLA